MFNEFPLGLFYWHNALLLVVVFVNKYSHYTLTFIVVVI